MIGGNESVSKIRIVADNQARQGTREAAQDVAAIGAAATQATGPMTRLGTEAKKTGTELDMAGQIARRFAGDDTISKANAYATAIDRVGGVSKLTRSEQNQANTAITNAIDKYRVLGQQAPAHLLSIKNATTQTSSSMTSMLGTVGKLGAAVGIGFSIGAVVNFGKELFTASGRVVDLSNKLGVSTDFIQRMDFLTQQAGGSVDQMADSAFKLGNNISNEVPKAKKAIDDLGLSFEVVRRMKPEEQYDAVARKLSGLTDVQERNRLGTDLMGKGYANVASAIGEYNKHVDRATVVQKEALEEIDNAADVVAEVWDGIVKGATTALATIIRGIREIRAEARSGPADTRPAWQSRAAWLGYMPDLPQDIDTQELRDQAAALSGSYMNATRRFQTPVLTNYVDQLAAARREIGQLTSAQRAQLDASRTLGDGFEELAESYGLSERAIKLYGAAATASAKQTVAAQKEIAKSAKEAQKDAEEWLADLRATLSTIGRVDVSRLLPQAWLGGRSIASMSMGAPGALPNFSKLGTPASFASLMMPIDWGGNRFPGEFGGGANAIGLSPEIIAALNVGTGRNWSATAGNLSTGFLSSFSGSYSPWGGMARNFGSQIGSQFPMSQGAAQRFGGGVQAFSGAMDWVAAYQANAGGGMSALSGAQTGAGIGTMIMPGIGTAIGAGIGALAGWASSIGGEGRRVNDMRDEFFAGRGGLGAVQRRVGDLGHDPGMMDAFGRVYNAATVKEFEQAVKDLEAAERRRMDALDKADRDRLAKLSEEEGARARLQSAIEKYGFTIGELGPKWQQQRLNEGAPTLLEDYTMLTASGINVDTVIKRMSGSMIAFLQDAVKTGGDVPQSMRPMVERMQEMGLLVDENGEKLVDLSKVKWSMTIEEGFQGVIDKLDELIRKITGDLTNALVNVPSPTITPQVNFPEPPEWFTRGGPREPNRPELVGADAGGMFTRPTFRVVAEKRPELVGAPDVFVDAFAAALKKNGGATGGGNIYITVQAHDARDAANQIIERIKKSGQLQQRLKSATRETR